MSVLQCIPPRCILCIRSPRPDPSPSRPCYHGIERVYRISRSGQGVNAEEDQLTTAWSDLSGVVLAAQDAIIGQELDGTIASWNIGATEIFGYASADILGRSISFLGAAESRKFPQTNELVRTGRRVAAHCDVFRRKSGENFVGSVAISPVIGANGKFLGLSWIIRPVMDPTASRDIAVAPDPELFQRSLRCGEATSGAGMHRTLVEELHQPLTAIGAYLRSVRHLSGQINEQSKLSVAIDNALKQLSRAADIVRKLNSFSAEEF